MPSVIYFEGNVNRLWIWKFDCNQPSNQDGEMLVDYRKLSHYFNIKHIIIVDNCV